MSIHGKKKREKKKPLKVWTRFFFLDWAGFSPVIGKWVFGKIHGAFFFVLFYEMKNKIK